MGRVAGHRPLRRPACILATADSEGQPSARFVLCRSFDADGFVLYTNQESRKAHELEYNPRAALVFGWIELSRQVRIEGPVTLVDDATADAYWASRPRAARSAPGRRRRARPWTTAISSTASRPRPSSASAPTRRGHRSRARRTGAATGSASSGSSSGRGGPTASTTASSTAAPPRRLDHHPPLPLTPPPRAPSATSCADRVHGSEPDPTHEVRLGLRRARVVRRGRGAVLVAVGAAGAAQEGDEDPRRPDDQGEDERGLERVEAVEPARRIARPAA